MALCERQTDRLEVFDYNGAYLRDIKIPTAAGDTTVTTRSFALGSGDTIFAVSDAPPRIYMFSSEGKSFGEFDILLDLNPTERAEQTLGSLAFINGQLYVPTPMSSQLVVYDTQGKLVKVYGFMGGGSGKLSFPVAVAPDGQGGTLVLDKHRHCVLQYGADGMFIQEFGGMGTGPGWFYHPISIATEDSLHCFVLQMFLGRVQAVLIPPEHPSDTQISVANPQRTADSAGEAKK